MYGPRRFLNLGFDYAFDANRGLALDLNLCVNSSPVIAVKALTKVFIIMTTTVPIML